MIAVRRAGGVPRLPLLSAGHGAVHAALWPGGDIRREQTTPGGRWIAAAATFALVYIHKNRDNAYFFL